ncbi:MAG: hypothetical protein CMI29_09510 [Opitutae bacterium]|nr:hypothetical protein [Opitutae bacterium]|tara:strand:- start:18294 stop:19193 length:900 start_codon:yes stop_codon:yes gene_type:complete
MTASLRAALFALPFVGAYFVARSLPVSPCDFLHEETYNSEGVLDYCGGGDSAFVDLSLRKWPLTLDFRPPADLNPGEVAELEMNIKQFDGSPLSADEVALSHTKKIHLLVVDESLTDYQHLHPEPDSIFDGTWRCALTPKNSGNYFVFFDFIPTRSPRRVLMTTSFAVDGNRIAESPVEENLLFASGKRRFELKKGEPDKDGGDLQLVFEASDESGETLALRPVMGAFAHMVAFDGDLNGFAHLHPLENALPAGQADIHKGPLTFTFSPPKEGLYRLWAQVRFSGESETFIPFDLRVGS